jgi:hypothetical protein
MTVDKPKKSSVIGASIAHRLLTLGDLDNTCQDTISAAVLNFLEMTVGNYSHLLKQQISYFGGILRLNLVHSQFTHQKYFGYMSVRFFAVDKINKTENFASDST